MIQTLIDILNLEGYSISSALNAYQAIALVKEKNFDVILMDYKMPGKNGVEAFYEIKEIAPTSKIIFITAYYNEKSINEALADGAIGVCNKPINIPQLLDLIRRAVFKH